MATYTNFKIWFWNNALSALGSTTNIISAQYKYGVDVIGAGEFTIPLVDTPARQYIAKYNVVTMTCEIDGEQTCFGEFVIDDIEEVFVTGGIDLLRVRGLGRLSRLKLDRANYQVISDGASGPGSSAVTDVLGLSQYTWSAVGVTYGSTFGNPPAYVVTANEPLLEVLLQVLLQNNHHFADIPGTSGLAGGNESLPENVAWLLQEMDQLSSSTVGFSGPHFKLDADEAAALELPILSVDKITYENEIITKAIIHGGGLGSGTFTMDAASGTKTAPSGYSYDFTNSTITNTALEAISNQPRKTDVANLSNIKPEDPTDATSVLTAAEQLTDAGQLWLEERTGGYEEYYRITTLCKITDAGTDRVPALGEQQGARLTLPKVSPYNAAGAESDTTIINIDKVMHILEAEYSVTAGTGENDNKLLGTFLLGPAPRQEIDGAAMVAEEIKELARRLDHADAQAASSSTPGGTTYVKTDAPLLTAVNSAALANERAGTNGLGTIFTDNGAGITFQTDIRTPVSITSSSTNTPGTTGAGHTHAIDATIATTGDLHDAVTLGADTAPLFSIGAGQILTFDNQTANTVLAGPTGGAAADPTMRALVFADVPTNSDPTGQAILASDANGRLGLEGLGIGTAAGAANQITIVNGGTIGQAAGPLLTFDDTANEIILRGGNLILNDGTAARLSIRRSGDVNNTESDLFAHDKLGLAATTSVAMFIDSDNATTDSIFGVWKHAEELSTATQLFQVDESGNVQLVPADCSLTFEGTDEGIRESSNTVEIFARSQVRIYVDTNNNSAAEYFSVYNDQAVGSSGTTGREIQIAGGVVVGNPTGGAKGIGTVNATAVYDDDTLLADFVFEPDYPLLTIDAMTAFYKTHKHLPTIPGREEWEKHGRFPLGKIVSHLWETVEAQAIYISQLNERMNHD